MFQQHEPALLRKRSFSERDPGLPLYYAQPQSQHSPFHQPQQPHQQLPSMSLGYLVSEDDRNYKRSRPELSYLPAFNQTASGFQPQHHQAQSQQPSQSYYHQPQPPSYTSQTPVFRSPVLSSVASPSGSVSPSSGLAMPSMIWETVIASGKFSSDVCLSETASQSGTGSKGVEGDPSTSSATTPSATTPTSENPVKQGRWTCGEKEFAEALILSVNKGEVQLPPNTSLRKFIADSLQCKAMRVSKKFRSLRSCQSPNNSSTTTNQICSGDSSPTDSDDGSQARQSFNPLSLSSIMNNEYESLSLASMPAAAHEMNTTTTTTTTNNSNSGSSMMKKQQRVLKRSDYSQHGMVRSGRWSLEEENYAKAMIEAFKNGYLPLHGNVSLRKFLSEVLVCHPMRISKKFVGYVRKYHWYRIAAGKCDPEAKQKALEELSQLERVFWASMQQSSDWVLAVQDE